MCPHKHPYHIQWLNESGKAKVTHTTHVHFPLGSYSDFVDCDVVPMQACSLLLGRPWEFDNDAIHHGRSNTYTLMHKGQKITLQPMTPAQIVQSNKERLANDAKSESWPEIKLKNPVMLATKYNLAEINDVCYALICKDALFSTDDISCTLPPSVNNLL
jgi:hypothetical protein